MKYPSRRFNKVAVLGAGVMGAQIAAHLANARVPVYLFELPAKGEDLNANVNKAIKALHKFKPAPFADSAAAHILTAANYEQHLPLLQECDLVIEAISERLDWKHDLYEKIVPHLHKDAVLVTNTSGISLEELGATLPAELKKKFCGVHFFNPPRYMSLLELIPRSSTEADVLDNLETFLVSTLGKGVVRAKDTPSFIGNRIGIFSILTVLHHAQRLAIPLDVIDELTGVGIGRPKSATCRTADVVGLDTLAHVVKNLYDTLPDDPWREFYKLPDWLAGLIEQGALGQKTKAGIYKKEGKDILVWESEKKQYRALKTELDPRIAAVFKSKDPSKFFSTLSEIDHPQAQFLLAIHYDLFQYSAVLLSDIAQSARDVDLAMRWGYGWKIGPFEMWQAGGWNNIAQKLQKAIDDGMTMMNTPLPKWAVDKSRKAVHTEKGSWSASKQAYVLPSNHPVYQRQLYPVRLLGEAQKKPEIVFQTDAVHAAHSGDDVLVLGFKTKMHTVSQAVLEGIQQAIDIAEADYKAMVVWQAEPPFSAGANLKDALESMKKGQPEKVTEMVQLFQQTTLRLRHSKIPTVAATQGLVLGGGCEILLHCDRGVAALESYIGLVETGVGLIPAAGGCKEMSLRASQQAAGGDVFPFLSKYFETIAMAKVAASALEAREFGYLRTDDKIVFNPHELLYVAKSEALAMFEAGYRQPLPETQIAVCGDAGIATLKAQLVNMLRGGFISEHDNHVASQLAHVMCGGDVHPGSLVEQDWLLRLEIDVFMALTMHPKTQERIVHTMTTGKPLRN